MLCSFRSVVISKKADQCIHLTITGALRIIDADGIAIMETLRFHSDPQLFRKVDAVLNKYFGDTYEMDGSDIPAPVNAEDLPPWRVRA